VSSAVPLALVTNNMADVSFVLSPPLCFIVKRYGKLESKVLRNVLVDFYKPEDISTAKHQLVSDMENVAGCLGLTGTPRLPRRIDGEKRIVHEVDDIITMFTFADENKLVSRLPKYVADSPDAMPYLRMVDSDFRLLLENMDKMQVTINNLVDVVYTMHALINNPMYNRMTSAINNTLGPTSASVVGLTGPVTSAGDNSSQSAHVCGKHCCSMGFPTTVHSAGGLGDLPSANSWAYITSQSASEPTTRQAQTAQIAHSNKNQVSEPTVQGDDGVPFQPVTSRRAQRNKRRRIQSKDNRLSEQLTYTTDEVDESDFGKINKLKQIQSTRRLIGKKRIDNSMSSSVNSKLMAAKPYLGKSVFCVDNVATDVSEEDLVGYVTDMNVNVISCYRVKPRRSLWQRQAGITPSGRNTFRLCVAREDIDKLLNAEMWPEHISISSWTFMKPRQQPLQQHQPSILISTGDKILNGSSSTGLHRQQQQNQPTSLAINTTTTDVTTDVITAVADEMTDMDATIIDYHNGDDNA
jgi:hypothetical protein